MRREPFAEEEVRRDAFLGGMAQIWQPKHGLGYRAGVDPVLLAAAVEAQPGQEVLELGCGGAPALVCLGARVGGLSLAGAEIQPAYAALARRNIAENGLNGEIYETDLAAPPAALKARSFDHVLANPPYFEEGKRSAAPDAGRELALAGALPLADWVTLAARRLKPRGTATFVQRVERLPELLAALAANLGSVEVLPLAPREGRAPRLILARGRKGGRAAFRLCPSLVLHAGACHLEDGDDYTNVIKAVLRDGKPISFSG
ncbi:tRNA1(Val) (adenine(37)-N6)-methyltransferase [Salipiger sp. PrR002]|uniref:tRNA1(Val) (adenine(37)-N6)-methyltransferase n=1 Tax=Salipiger sp. PrR002 TaxID=2706489 RepID=UPI0013BCBD8A|nr:methyltransferase [Salipiger sp. PrR002]NDV98495.1 methyltransferase [Salipiger sp. PrR002]NDW57330.1 methyltransferase [Salipiger sp. PrR004]